MTFVTISRYESLKYNLMRKLPEFRKVTVNATATFIPTSVQIDQHEVVVAPTILFENGFHVLNITKDIGIPESKKAGAHVCVYT